jgi:hypothetical protein
MGPLLLYFGAYEISLVFHISFYSSWLVSCYWLDPGHKVSQKHLWQYYQTLKG